MHRRRGPGRVAGCGVVSALGDLRRKLVKGVRVAAVPAYRPALRKGVAPSIELNGLDLPDGIATVFDVGANRGQFMLWASHRFPGARIWSFEPLPAAREVLASVVPEGRDVTISPLGLGAAAGRSAFHVAQADDSSSLLEAGEEQLRMAPGSAAGEKIEIEVARLDETVEADFARPALLKIDVQGTELDVLEGAAGLLGRIDFILAECSFVELYRGQALAHEVIAFLAGRGFRLVGICSPTTGAGGRTVQADLLFAQP